MLEVWIGVAGGILMGSTGSGLGLLVTPLLILAGYNPAVAVGTGLGVSVISKLIGVVVHDRLGHWVGRQVWVLLMGGAAGVAVAWCVVSQVVIPARIDQDAWLKCVLAVMLLSAAIAVLKMDRTRGKRLVAGGLSRALLFPIGLVSRNGAGVDLGWLGQLADPNPRLDDRMESTPDGGGE